MCTKTIEYRRSRSRSPQRRRSSRFAVNLLHKILFNQSLHLGHPSVVVVMENHGTIETRHPILIYCGTYFNSSPRGDSYKQHSYGDRVDRDGHTEVKEDDDGI